jgi:hypothetical protein
VFADALEGLAAQLKKPLDDLVGFFTSGLLDDIYQAGMVEKQFETFSQAVETAKRIEENLQERRARLLAQPVLEAINAEEPETQEILAPYQARPSPGRKHTGVDGTFVS